MNILDDIITWYGNLPIGIAGLVALAAVFCTILALVLVAYAWEEIRKTRRDE